MYFEYLCFTLSCYNIMFKSNYCLGVFPPVSAYSIFQTVCLRIRTEGLSTVPCAGAEPCRGPSQRCVRGEKSCSDLALPVLRPQHTQGRDAALAENNVDLARQAFVKSSSYKTAQATHWALLRHLFSALKGLLFI